jgi:hypothetical protein
MIHATEAFEPLRAALERAGVRFAVGGSWASTAFGEPRMTNGIDILADLTPENLDGFLAMLPDGYFVDRDEARSALRLGRPFNVIYMPVAFKFDFFGARAFPLGVQELERAVSLSGSGISDAPVPFVTPEDILLAKLHWFKAGGGVSGVQWRDIEGLVRQRRESLDHEYLKQSAATLGVIELLQRVFGG